MAACSIELVLQQALQQLQGSTTARLDAELLLASVLQKSRSFLRAFPETELASPQAQQFQTLLARRSLGKPLAYILGEKEFFSLPFKVTSDVLIPRPETELLVETALAIFSENMPIEVCDLGTGCGAIALTIAKLRPQWHVAAVDKSVAALEIAKENAMLLKLSNVDFFCSDWLQMVPPKKFTLIISNPPYIASDDLALEKDVARYEPAIALLAKDDGLADLKTIAQQATGYLTINGQLLLEHGYQQGLAVAAVLQTLGYQNVETLKDINALPRMTIGYYK